LKHARPYLLLVLLAGLLLSISNCGSIKDPPVDDPGLTELPAQDIPSPADLVDSSSGDAAVNEDLGSVDSSSADTSPATDEGIASDETSTDPGTTVEDSLSDVASAEDPGQSASDPGEPDPGQPDPGQPDPGQPDPGQPDPGPGDVPTLDTAGCDLPPPNCPGAPAPGWELEDMAQEPPTSYGLNAFSGHVVVVALFSAT